MPDGGRGVADVCHQGGRVHLQRHLWPFPHRPVRDPGVGAGLAERAAQAGVSGRAGCGRDRRVCPGAGPVVEPGGPGCGSRVSRNPGAGLVGHRGGRGGRGGGARGGRLPARRHVAQPARLPIVRPDRDAGHTVPAVPVARPDPGCGPGPAGLYCTGDLLLGRDHGRGVAGLGRHRAGVGLAAVERRGWGPLCHLCRVLYHFFHQRHRYRQRAGRLAGLLAGAAGGRAGQPALVLLPGDGAAVRVPAAAADARRSHLSPLPACQSRVVD